MATDSSFGAPGLASLSQAAQREEWRPTDDVADALARCELRVVDFGVKRSRRFMFGAMNPRPHARLRARWLWRGEY